MPELSDYMYVTSDCAGLKGDKRAELPSLLDQIQGTLESRDIKKSLSDSWR